MNRKEWSKRPGRSANWITRTRRFAIYHRDGFKCLYCQKRPPKLAYDGVGLTLDHVVSRKDGGSDDSTNLVTACIRCNSKRQHKALRAPTLKRLQAYTERRLNMEVGRLLALLHARCRQNNLVNPLMVRERTEAQAVPLPYMLSLGPVPTYEQLVARDAAMWREQWGIKDDPPINTVDFRGVQKPPVVEEQCMHSVGQISEEGLLNCAACGYVGEWR